MGSDRDGHVSHRAIGYGARKASPVASAQRLLAPPVAMDGSIDDRPAYAEVVGELGPAVLAAAVEGNQVCLLARVELGLPCRAGGRWR